jgi:cytochrome P450
MKRGQRRPDVFNWLHQAYLQGPQTKSDTLKLHGDGYLVIVAGSDTTASTITHLLFYLACNKPLTQKLQAQLDKLDELNDERLRDVELLDACISETLRLRPAVPAGVQRETPKEGMYIGDRYIPGNTIVKVPMYTLFRGEQFFNLYLLLGTSE